MNMARKLIIGVGCAWLALNLWAGENYWTSHGPNRGTVRALAIHPQNPAILYAAMDYEGILKSTDGGATWTNIWSNAEAGISYNLNVQSLAIVPSAPATIYAVVYGGGVFKSTDAGETWAAVNAGLPTDLCFFTVTVDPLTPQTVYLGTGWHGVYKSLDGGASWSAANAGYDTVQITALIVDPQTPTTVYAGTYNRGVLKSLDGGASWTAMNSGLTSTYVFALVRDPVSPGTLYAGSSGAVFKSTDGGVNWASSGSGIPASALIQCLAIDPQSPSRLYAGTNSCGIYQTGDGGATWTATGPGVMDLKVLALAVDPQTPATLYAGTRSGVFKSVDRGVVWTDINARCGNVSLRVRAVAVDPQTPTTLYAATIWGRDETASGGVFKSTDGGNTWKAVNTGLMSDDQTLCFALAIDPNNSATLFVAGGRGASGKGGGIYKTVDGGAHWSLVRSMAYTDDVDAILVDPNDSAIVYVVDDGDLLKSVDGGATWNQVSTLGGIRNLAFHPSSPSVLFAVTAHDLHRSTDRGENWTAVNVGLTEWSIGKLAIDPVNPDVIYLGTGGGVFKSVDGGANFTSINVGLSVGNGFTDLVIDPSHPSTVYAGNYGRGVFRTVDGGLHWQPINAGLSDQWILDLAMDPLNPGQLHAAGDGGGDSGSVFSITLTDTSAVLYGEVRYPINALFYKPLAGVVMNGLPDNPVTDAEGFYCVSLPKGWSGTVTPAKAGFVFDPVSSSYASLQADMTAQNYAADYAVKYTVTFVAGTGGTVSGTNPQRLPGGWTTSKVTAVANDGYRFVNWTGTGFATSTANPLTVTGVTGDLTITANFAATSPASIGLNHSRLNYGKAGSAVTSAQTLLVRNIGAAP